MNRVLRLLRLLPVLIVLAVRASEPPRFGELLDLVRSNLTDVSEAQLNDAIVNGLLDQLQPRVFLLTNDTAGAGASVGTLVLISRTNVFESAFAYLRVDQIADGLGEAVRAGLDSAGATNALKGLVLDLRFAGGEDFREAGRVADLFVSEAQPLLDWAEGSVAATDKTNAVSLPLAVLVNSETRGAAEALAAVVQETRSGLVIGRPTAGQAAIFREIPLSTGQHLRVAVAPVKAGRGGRVLPWTGVAPDITLTPATADERKHWDDPYRLVPGTVARTNASRLPRLTEADLVRLHREGLDPAGARLRRPEAPAAPQVTDPALLRALDLLKGLAVVESRQP